MTFRLLIKVETYCKLEGGKECCVFICFKFIVHYYFRVTIFFKLYDIRVYINTVMINGLYMEVSSLIHAFEVCMCSHVLLYIWVHVCVCVHVCLCAWRWHWVYSWTTLHSVKVKSAAEPKTHRFELVQFAENAFPLCSWGLGTEITGSCQYLPFKHLQHFVFFGKKQLIWYVGCSGENAACMIHSPVSRRMQPRDWLWRTFSSKTEWNSAWL